MSSPPPPYRWVMLAALWLTYTGFGMVNASMAPLITPICDDLGLSRSAMGLVLGAWAMVYIAAAIPSGALLDRIGTPKGIAIGIFIIAASGFARAVAVDFVTLFIAVGIFGIGGPLMSVGAPKLIAQWFESKERGTAVGIYMTGPFIGTALSLASANSVFMPLFNDSWRLTVGAFAVVSLIAGFVWLAVAREPAVSPIAPTESKGHAGLREFAPLLRVPLVQTVLLIALAGFMFNHAISNWLAEILRSRGLDASAAGFWASMPTLVGIVSSLTIPRFAVGKRRIDILTGLYLCLIVATLMLAFTDGMGLYVSLVLFGVARIMGPILMLVLMEAPKVEARNMGAATGLYFTVGEIGGVIGPVIIGVTADLTGGFQGGIFVLALLAAYLFVMTFSLRRVLAKQRYA
jgi:MFS transporter, CP family, cyanate transporter